MDAGTHARHRLGLFSAICLVIGTIVGSGIFASSQTILAGAGAGSISMIFVAWAFGGALSLMGALCYAELASRFPANGGDYLFLRAAFGLRLAFFYAWTKFWIIRPGSIAAMAFFCASSLATAFGAPADQVGYIALAVVAVLTVINVVGLQEGKVTQNFLTVLKVVLLVGLCVACFWTSTWHEQPQAPTAMLASPSWELVLIFVLFTYGGWNELAFVTGDMREPRRHMLPALMLGTVAVILIYCLFSLALLFALGLPAISTAPDLLSLIADHTLAPWFGDGARAALHLTIAISALGAINGLVFTGGRIYAAVGRDFPAVRWLSQTRTRDNNPALAICAEGIVALVLILLFLGQPNQFEYAVVYTTPVFWAFMVLIGLATWRLRKLGLNQADEPAYELPFYPWPLLAYLAMAAFLLYSSTSYAISETTQLAWGMACVVLSGGITAAVIRPR